MVQPTPSKEDILGAHRTLIKWEGFQPRSRVITLEFSDNGLNFDCGCNLNSGPYLIEGERLFAKEISSTEMACFPSPFEGLGSPNQDEAWLRDFLSKGPVISVNDENLTLRHEDVELTFGNASERPPIREFIAFYETIWLIDEIQNEAVSVIRLQDDSPSVIFFMNDTLVVNTGCNIGTGKFTVLSQSITLNNIDFTDSNCTPESIQITDDIIQNMFRSVEIQVDKDGGLMKLRTKKLGISLVAKPTAK